MKLTAFIVALRSEEHSSIPLWAEHSLKCAKQFAHTDVVGLSDMPTDGWIDTHPYSESADRMLASLESATKYRLWPSVIRWFIIDSYCRRHGIRGPIVSLDWDILVFGDLQQHFTDTRCLETDLASAFIRCNCAYQGPTVIRDVEIVRMFVEHMAAQPTMVGTNQIFMSDMDAWHVVRRLFRLTDCLTISHTGFSTYWDSNSTLDGDLFEMDERGKKIYWEADGPHYNLTYYKKRPRVVAMHTFVPWRFHTQELMDHLL